MCSQFYILVLAVVFLQADPTQDNDLAKKEVAGLQGRWIVESFEYGGEKHASERDVQTWNIVGNRIVRSNDSEKLDVLEYEIHPAESPRHLDLVSTKGEKPYKQGGLVARTQTIYSLEGDRLKVAMSYDFLPMAPEQEKQQAIKWAGIRPKSFETKDGGTAVLLFKRIKK